LVAEADKVNDDKANRYFLNMTFSLSKWPSIVIMFHLFKPYL